ncbi:FAD-binding oxidoreductase [Pseudanabaena sp. FACHB-1998]|uniref:FAD-binding oxidoreductase n=1 Tax=Pseudanabaena sp. FACHB-1998 TaxID=2692858 RepID=UPI0016808985|nr:FAD-binding oxidoreductase [Pseudanabaena sp. FACHB-1998]MBD2176226.1 FAD-binding oxidoreductase [Pseudanabaena sp. FACHB-1998]
MSLFETVKSQMPAEIPAQLERMDAFWSSYRQQPQAIAKVVSSSQSNLGDRDFDVIVCGGTLGIFIACALQIKGWQVAVIEQGLLRGRTQEWNISRKELNTFLELNLLTEIELEAAIATVYNPARVGFQGGKDLWVRDILNIGVDPVYLLEVLKQKFLDDGGTLLEKAAFKQAIVYSDGVAVEVKSISNDELKILTGRLLLDVMGHFSPIAKQGRSLVQGNIKPDGVCMVVGSCAKGLPEKPYGDLIYSFAPIQNQCQYFWEAFPAKDGRTTYMFTYVDADPLRPSFAQLMEDYLFWLPKYQEVELKQIQFERVLFGFFPSYKQNPLQTPWDRILQVGDSSGMQSPLSFGGFGAMVRHLPRLTMGIEAALGGDLLAKENLRSLQPYQPNLSVTWLFQKSMSVAVNQQIESDRINYLLGVTFTAMEKLGDQVLYPFLQDVVQFIPLAKTMLAMSIADPVLVLKIMQQVGFGALLDWLKHYFNLGAYSFLNQIGDRLEPAIANLLPEQQYQLNRKIEAWYYGSGGDYESAAKQRFHNLEDAC